MKFILSILSVNIVSLAAVAFAGYLATHDKTGWGWFLFIALITQGSVKIKN